MNAMMVKSPQHSALDESRMTSDVRLRRKNNGILNENA